jgi:hypothetical protein
LASKAWANIREILIAKNEIKTLKSLEKPKRYQTKPSKFKATKKDKI